MPITQSAKKANRQSKKRKLHNDEVKTRFKSEIKQFKKLVLAKNMAAAKEKIPAVYKSLDKAAKVNVIKKNTASRLKSKLTKLMNKAEASA